MHERRPVSEESFRYEGWRVVAVCFLVATFAWGLGFYGQSVYLAELHRLHGWPAALISTATTCFYLCGALLALLVSDAIRRFGPRNCLTVGILALAAAAAAMGQVREPWQLYAADALLAVGWASTSLAMITTTLSLWFDARRGMAISLALNGASFGGIAGVPLLVGAVGAFGFSQAMLLTAGATLILLLPAVLILIGTAPQRPGRAAAGPNPSSVQIRKQALRDPRFLSVAIAFALVQFAQVGFIVHLIAFLDPVIGRTRGALALSVLTVMAVVGRLLFSAVIDRIDQRAASALSFISQAAALGLIMTAQNELLLFVACAAFGFSVGNLITLPSLIVQREFDPQAFGALIGLVTAINQVTYAFGPGIVGLLRDASGGYTAPFLVCVGLELSAAALIMSRRRPAVT